MNPKNGKSSLFDLLCVVAAVAHLPMGVEYCLRMWRTGHYQFFPFLFAIVLWLIYERVSPYQNRARYSPISYVLFGLNLFLLAASVVLYSSTVWMLSVLLLFVTIIFHRYGLRACVATAPAWLLLLFVFPLPAGIDIQLINKLQFLSSQLASWTLDAARLLHFREGVVLITEKKQFFAEEACSGVRSLFSSLAAISVFGVYARYSAVRTIFNLIQTTFWVLIGNAFRIAVVVYVADNWTESIASGAAHEALGFGVFLLIFMLSICTDKTLGLLVGNGSQNRLADEQPQAVGADLSAGQTTQGWLKPVQFGLAVLFVGVTLFSCRLTYAKLSQEQQRESSFSSTVLSQLGLEDLPAEVAGWKRVSFEHTVRNEHSLLAPESYIWTFEQSGIEATISVDSPYYEYHNLKTCYDGLGWTCQCTHRYGGVSDKLTESGQRSQLTMQKKDQRGVVLFTAFDRNGRLVLPNEAFYVGSRFDSIRKNIELGFGMTARGNENRMASGAMPISQIQLIANYPDVDRFTGELESLFHAARISLVDSSRFQGQ
jgi:exosortase